MCKRVIFVVDSLFFTRREQIRGEIFKKACGRYSTNVFAADRSTEKRKRLCGASMLLGNDAKFLLRD